MQEELATAEERLRSARLEAALDEHGAKVAAGVSRLREGGASDLEIAVYEAEQAGEEAKIDASAEVQVAPHHPGNSTGRHQVRDLSRFLRFGAWVQEYLAAAEERLRSAKLEEALDQLRSA